jgi:hypothetical protein
LKLCGIATLRAEQNNSQKVVMQQSNWGGINPQSNIALPMQQTGFLPMQPMSPMQPQPQQPMNPVSWNGVPPPQMAQQYNHQQQMPGTPQSKVTWTYIDASGIVQGPFDEPQLVGWMQVGHFCNRTLAKRSNDDIYRSLVVHGFTVNQNDVEAREMEAWRYQDWYYIDTNNIKQGPFKLAQMRQWTDRFFDETTLLCCGNPNGKFTPLGDTVIGHKVDDSSVLLPQNSPPSSAVPSTSNSNVAHTSGNNNSTDGAGMVVQNSGIATSSNTVMTPSTTKSNIQFIGNNNNGDNSGMIAAPQQGPSATNQSQDSLRSVKEELRSMKMALQGSQHSERNSLDEQNRLQQKYEALDKKYQDTIQKLREASDKLHSSEEAERRLQQQINDQKKQLSHLKIYERTVNVYLKPAMELVEKAEKSSRQQLDESTSSSHPNRGGTSSSHGASGGGKTATRRRTKGKGSSK